MQINGAIFDMDGTLVDSLSFWGFMWHEVGKKYLGVDDFTPDEAVDKRVRTMIYNDAMAWVKEIYNIPGETEDFINFTLDGVEDFYRNVAMPKEGAVELLEYLTASGIKICLASATEMKYINIALEAHGLRKYFDAVLSCDDIGIGKDKPDIYILAAEALGEECAELCVVEDSFVALETAKAAGFKTVGVYDKYNFEQGRLKAAADIYLGEGSSLAELRKIFSQRRRKSNLL